MEDGTGGGWGVKSWAPPVSPTQGHYVINELCARMYILCSVLRVFENGVVRRGDWRQQHSEELRDFCCSPDTVRVGK